EALKVAAVWGEEDRLEAFELAFLLELAPQRDGLAEHLESLLLAPPHSAAPAHEDRVVSHTLSFLELTQRATLMARRSRAEDARRLGVAHAQAQPQGAQQGVELGRVAA